LESLVLILKKKKVLSAANLAGSSDPTTVSAEQLSQPAHTSTCYDRQTDRAAAAGWELEKDAINPVTRGVLKPWLGKGGDK